MSRADVKLTLRPIDFNLVIEALKEKLELLEQNMRDEELGGEAYQESGSEKLHLERLLRELE
jgi:hypothetical protein